MCSVIAWKGKNEFEKIKLGEFNALQQKFKSLNKYEKPINKQMQDTESKKDAIRHDMRVLNRWVADQYAKLLSYKVESMDIPTRDFTGMTTLNARKSKRRSILDFQAIILCMK